MSYYLTKTNVNVDQYLITYMAVNAIYLANVNIIYICKYYLAQIAFFIFLSFNSLFERLEKIVSK